MRECVANSTCESSKLEIVDSNMNLFDMVGACQVNSVDGLYPSHLQVLIGRFDITEMNRLRYCCCSVVNQGSA